MPLLHKRPAIYALVGLTLVAVALIAGVFSLSPRQQAGAADAGTALDFDGKIHQGESFAAHRAVIHRTAVACGPAPLLRV